MTTTPSAPNPLLLRVRGLEARRAGFAVRLPSLDLGPGEVVAITGPSGAGKSTLLAALLGAAPRTAAELAWFGADGPPARAVRARRIAWVPQVGATACDPNASLADLARRLAPRSGVADLRAALDLADLPVDPAWLRRGVAAVSGGELRRFLLAVMAARRPAVWVLDEPTAGLDRRRAAAFAAALARTVAAGDRDAAALVASHDPELVVALGARSLRIDGGVAVAVDRGPEPPRFEAWPPAAAAAAEPVIEARGLAVRHGRREVVRGVDLTLFAGGCVALTGPSGAGKSSLARVLAGHARPARGELRIPRDRRDVQLLHQDAGASLTPHLSVGRLLDEADRGGVDRARAQAALGLDPALLDRPAAALSGGEARRVALMRALVARPRALILDEPTAGLDAAHAEELVTLLREVRDDTGVGMLWITHDDRLADAVAPVRIRLDESGRIEPATAPAS